MVYKDPDDVFGEEDGDTKTAFNSALDIIQRISRLEYSLLACFIEKPEDLRGAHKILVLIHSEIDFKLSKEESEELLTDEEEIYKTLPSAMESYTHNGKIYPKFQKIREQTLLKLMELKKKISRLKYKAGLGMIDQSDPRYALLNG